MLQGCIEKRMFGRGLAGRLYLHSIKGKKQTPGWKAKYWRDEFTKQVKAVDKEKKDLDETTGVPVSYANEFSKSLSKKKEDQKVFLQISFLL